MREQTKLPVVVVMFCQRICFGLTVMFCQSEAFDRKR